MPRNQYNLTRLDLSEQEYADRVGRLDAGVAYFVDGELKSIGAHSSTSFARSLIASAGYIPSVMASPPNTSLSSSLGANTLPASSITNGQDIAPWEPVFTWLGAPFKRYNGNSVVTTGVYPTAKSAGTSFAEFNVRSFDSTGRFEINYHGNSAVSGHGVRVLVMNQATNRWEYVTQGVTFASSTANLADVYKGLVTLGAAGTYSIRLEFSSGFTFRSLTVGPDDIVSPTPAPSRRVFLSGNSYTAGSVSDTGVTFPAGDCFPALLCYLTGWDIIPCGIGGADYTVDVTPGTRVSSHIAADLASVLPVHAVLSTHGTNDLSSGNSAASIGAEAAIVRQLIARVAPTAEIISTSPMWYRSLLETSLSKALAIKDAIRSAFSGDKWIDLMTKDPAAYLGAWAESVPAGGLAVAATTMTLRTVPPAIAAIIAQGSVAAARNDWYIRIGAGDTAEVRKVTACTAAGAITFGALTFAHDGGEPVTLSGPSYITGVGSQLSFTGALVDATSATLSSAWQGPTGPYTVTFSDGTRKTSTLTNNSAALSWTGAVTATAIASCCSIAAGNAGRVIGPDQVHPPREGHVLIAHTLNAELRGLYA